MVEHSVEPLQNRIQQLERLLEVGRNLSALLDLGPLLQTIIDAAAELTFSQESSILLYDERQNNLEFVAAPWFKNEQMREIRVPLEISVVGQVFAHGEPILVRDAMSDTRLYRPVDEQTGFVTRSMLAVPMLFQARPIGVLTAVNKLGDSPYAEDDVHILEILASQAAIAIKNANLLQQTQQAVEELTELDRMKSDFIAITSHELRTPLGLILGHATFLSEMVNEELRGQMDVIVRSSIRLKEIVEDLSKVNTIQTGLARVRRREVNLNVLIYEVVNQFKELAEQKKIRLTASLPPRKLLIEGDSEKIGIAVGHLVKNAVTFTDEGGTVEVLAEDLPGHYKISVRDTGIGIPEKDQARIFERFYQVESHMTRRHGGMGLGLSVAKMMVEMHNGRIGLESREGTGTTFSILLPVSKNIPTPSTEQVFRRAG